MAKDNLLSKFTGTLIGCGICDSYVLPLKNLSTNEIKNIIVQQAVIEKDGGFAGVYSGENSHVLNEMIQTVKDMDFNMSKIADAFNESRYPFLSFIFFILPNFSRISNLEKLITFFFPDNIEENRILKAMSFFMIKMLMDSFNTDTIFDEVIDYINDTEFSKKIFLLKNLFFNKTKPAKALEKFSVFDTNFCVLASALYCFMFSYQDFDSVLENATLYSIKREDSVPLAGAFIGASMGLDAFPIKYIKNLSTQKDIYSIAKKLFNIALKT